jgi:hypothetical protein
MKAAQTLHGMAESAKKPTIDTALELALALLAGRVFLALVFAGTQATGLEPWLPRVLAWDLLLAFGLLVARVARNRRGPSLTPAFRPGRWLSRLGPSGLVLSAGLLVATAMQHHERPGLGIDGPLLFVQVRSAVIDRDLDLTNEFRDFVPQKFQHWAEEARELGKSPDPNAEPGPALLWSPFYVAAHVLVRIARGLGSTVAADGYSAPYVNAVCVASLFWAFVGVCLAYRVCRRVFPPLLAAVCVIGFWFASPLLWYSVFEPAMPHAPAAAVVGGFVVLWLRLEREPAATARWLAIAFAFGLLISMNRYEVYFAILPAMTLLRLAVRSGRGLTRARLRHLALTVVGLVGAFSLAALPFFVLNLRSREGQLFREQSLWGFSLQFARSPRIGEILFSSAHGLLSWTPLAGIGLIGLCLLLRRERRLAAAFLLTLGSGLVILAASYDWTGGWSFGSRRMTEAFALFALGLCAVAQALLRAPQVLGTAALGGFVVWNLLLAGQMDRGEIPRVGTVSFRDIAERAVGRGYGAFGHPGAFPASWLFAWRYGVSPERFDRLYGHAPLGALRLPMGTAQAEAYLGRGFSHAEESDGLLFRWSDGPDSTLLVPLLGARSYHLRLRGTASRHPEGLPLTVDLWVNGRAAGALTFTRETANHEAFVPAPFWRTGINEIRLVYGWTVEAREVYRTRETRRLAWRAEEVELQPAAQ